MEAKKTIAILGLTKGSEKPFLGKLANDSRLLIVAKDANDLEKVCDYLSCEKSEYEAEVINCAKDCCWEADIIILWNPVQFQEEELIRLQKVTTQKTVLIINEPEQDLTNLPLFPLSKIVILTTDPISKMSKLHGEDLEAVDLIRDLISKTGLIKLEK